MADVVHELADHGHRLVPWESRHLFTQWPARGTLPRRYFVVPLAGTRHLLTR
ncbi:hypothetical protein [Nonomuraea sp. NPDC002799]